MPTEPLKIAFTITADQIAVSKEAASQNPIKIIVSRRLSAPSTSESSKPVSEPAAALELDDIPPLTLKVADKAGIAYTIKDGILPPANGVVSSDGWLIHTISPEADICHIVFQDDEITHTVILDSPYEESQDFDWNTDPDTYSAEEAEDTALSQIIEPEDAPPLTIQVIEKAGQTYVLDDHISPPSQGVVAADGMLIHHIHIDATSCVIRFEDREKIE
ncbi:MAG: hypothetical protein AAFP03_19580, partial [Cyanobacteria bacterium J06598_3]